MKWTSADMIKTIHAMMQLIRMVLGKFKDECEGKIMTGFIGLRPKCYAFKIHGDDKEYKKCKGTAKNTVKRKIKYGDYNKALETNEVTHRSFNSIRSKNHKIYIVLILQR